MFSNKSQAFPIREQQCKPRKMQVRGHIMRTSKDDCSKFTKYNFLQSHFEYDFSSEMSRRIAHEFIKKMKSKRKVYREVPTFADTVRNEVLYLHEYNLTVFKVTQLYPFSEEYTQFLMQYVLLECKILYRREYYSKNREKQTQERVLRVLLNIYNDYFESKQLKRREITERSMKSIIEIFVKIRTHYNLKYIILENMTVTLLKKNGHFEKIDALRDKPLPFLMDSNFSPDPSLCIYKNASTSDYGTDDGLSNAPQILNIDNCYELSPTMEEDVDEIKNEYEPILGSQEKNVNKNTKFVYTICLDESGLDSDEEIVFYTKEIETKKKERIKNCTAMKTNTTLHQKLHTSKNYQLHCKSGDSIKSIIEQNSASGINDNDDLLQQIDNILTEYNYVEDKKPIVISEEIIEISDDTTSSELPTYETIKDSEEFTHLTGSNSSRQDENHMEIVDLDDVIELSANRPKEHDKVTELPTDKFVEESTEFDRKILQNSSHQTEVSMEIIDLDEEIEVSTNKSSSPYEITESINRSLEENEDFSNTIVTSSLQQIESNNRISNITEATCIENNTQLPKIECNESEITFQSSVVNIDSRETTEKDINLPDSQCSDSGFLLSSDNEDISPNKFLDEEVSSEITNKVKYKEICPRELTINLYQCTLSDFNHFFIEGKSAKKKCALKIEEKIPFEENTIAQSNIVQSTEVDIDIYGKQKYANQNLQGGDNYNTSIHPENLTVDLNIGDNNINGNCKTKVKNKRRNSLRTITDSEEKLESQKDTDNNTSDKFQESITNDPDSCHIEEISSTKPQPSRIYSLQSYQEFVESHILENNEEMEFEIENHNTLVNPENQKEFLELVDNRQDTINQIHPETLDINTLNIQEDLQMDDNAKIQKINTEEIDNISYTKDLNVSSEEGNKSISNKGMETVHELIEFENKRTKNEKLIKRTVNNEQLNIEVTSPVNEQQIINLEVENFKETLREEEVVQVEDLEVTVDNQTKNEKTIINTDPEVERGKATHKKENEYEEVSINTTIGIIGAIKRLTEAVECLVENNQVENITTGIQIENEKTIVNNSKEVEDKGATFENVKECEDVSIVETNEQIGNDAASYKEIPESFHMDDVEVSQTVDIECEEITTVNQRENEIININGEIDKEVITYEKEKDNEEVSSNGKIETVIGSDTEFPESFSIENEDKSQMVHTVASKKEHINENISGINKSNENKEQITNTKVEVFLQGNCTKEEDIACMEETDKNDTITIITKVNEKISPTEDYKAMDQEETFLSPNETIQTVRSMTETKIDTKLTNNDEELSREVHAEKREVERESSVTEIQEQLQETMINEKILQSEQVEVSSEIERVNISNAEEIIEIVTKENDEVLPKVRVEDELKREEQESLVIEVREQSGIKMSVEKVFQIEARSSDILNTEEIKDADQQKTFDNTQADTSTILKSDNEKNDIYDHFITEKTLDNSQTQDSEIGKDSIEDDTYENKDFSEMCSIENECVAIVDKKITVADGEDTSIIGEVPCDKKQKENNETIDCDQGMHETSCNKEINQNEEKTPSEEINLNIKIQEELSLDHKTLGEDNENGGTVFIAVENVDKLNETSCSSNDLVIHNKEISIAREIENNQSIIDKEQKVPENETSLKNYDVVEPVVQTADRVEDRKEIIQEETKTNLLEPGIISSIIINKGLLLNELDKKESASVNESFSLSNFKGENKEIGDVSKKIFDKSDLSHSDWNMYKEKNLNEEHFIDLHRLATVAVEIKQKSETPKSRKKSKGDVKNAKTKTESIPKKNKSAKGRLKKLDLMETADKVDDEKRITRSAYRKNIYENVMKPQEFKNTLPINNVKIHQLPDSLTNKDITDSDSNDSEFNKLFIDDKKVEDSEDKIYNEDTDEENHVFNYKPRLLWKDNKGIIKRNARNKKPKTKAQIKSYDNNLNPYVSIMRLEEKNKQKDAGVDKDSNSPGNEYSNVEDEIKQEILKKNTLHDDDVNYPIYIPPKLRYKLSCKNTVKFTAEKLEQRLKNEGSDLKEIQKIEQSVDGELVNEHVETTVKDIEKIDKITDEIPVCKKIKILSNVIISPRRDTPNHIKIFEEQASSDINKSMQDASSTIINEGGCKEIFNNIKDDIGNTSNDVTMLEGKILETAKQTSKDTIKKKNKEMIQLDDRIKDTPKKNRGIKKDTKDAPCTKENDSLKKQNIKRIIKFEEENINIKKVKTNLHKKEFNKEINKKVELTPIDRILRKRTTRAVSTNNRVDSTITEDSQENTSLNNIVSKETDTHIKSKKDTDLIEVKNKEIISKSTPDSTSNTKENKDKAEIDAPLPFLFVRKEIDDIVQKYIKNRNSRSTRRNSYPETDLDKKLRKPVMDSTIKTLRTSKNSISKSYIGESEISTGSTMTKSRSKSMSIAECQKLVTESDFEKKTDETEVKIRKSGSSSKLKVNTIENKRILRRKISSRELELPPKVNKASKVKKSINIIEGSEDKKSNVPNTSEEINHTEVPCTVEDSLINEIVEKCKPSTHVVEESTVKEKIFTNNDHLSEDLDIEITTRKINDPCTDIVKNIDKIENIMNSNNISEESTNVAPECLKIETVTQKSSQTSIENMQKSGDHKTDLSLIPGEVKHSEDCYNENKEHLQNVPPKESTVIHIPIDTGMMDERVCQETKVENEEASDVQQNLQKEFGKELLNDDQDIYSTNKSTDDMPKSVTEEAIKFCTETNNIESTVVPLKRTDEIKQIDIKDNNLIEKTKNLLMEMENIPIKKFYGSIAQNNLKKHDMVEEEINKSRGELSDMKYSKKEEIKKAGNKVKRKSLRLRNKKKSLLDVSKKESNLFSFYKTKNGTQLPFSLQNKNNEKIVTVNNDESIDALPFSQENQSKTNTIDREDGNKEIENKAIVESHKSEDACQESNISSGIGNEIVELHKYGIIDKDFNTIDKDDDDSGIENRKTALEITELHKFGATQEESEINSEIGNEKTAMDSIVMPSSKIIHQDCNINTIIDQESANSGIGDEETVLETGVVNEEKVLGTAMSPKPDKVHQDCNINTIEQEGTNSEIEKEEMVLGCAEYLKSDVIHHESDIHSGIVYEETVLENIKSPRSEIIYQDCDTTTIDREDPNSRFKDEEMVLERTDAQKSGVTHQDINIGNEEMVLDTIITPRTENIQQDCNINTIIDQEGTNSGIDDKEMVLETIDSVLDTTISSRSENILQDCNINTVDQEGSNSGIDDKEMVFETIDLHKSDFTHEETNMNSGIVNEENIK
ncbi:uncharacterized protein LOC130447127 [Diorhabda sublineata]|uniref:uncharacterized protein LOC130447127 n=1 Tax=Diorhabda sublineata TaxID=1163346 RepID=UPI0024E08873|nr:uncharacterized protein LOC130447127 [Diorhabda sublineata]